MKLPGLLTIAAALFATEIQLHAQDLYRMDPTIQPRWASPENPKGLKGAAATTLDGRKGRPSVPLKAGAALVLAEASGTSGTIRRIWITIEKRSPQMLRAMRIDCYWDGAKKPAVSAPLGDFFGVGLGRMAAFQSALFSDPEGRSFNCFVPMPFRTGMKIVLTNESGTDLDMVFYDVDYTIGDRHGDDALYFHAWFNREDPTALRHDYAILAKVTGRGRFLGANVGVIADRQYHGCWWGEGEVKVYLDGDTANPTLSGTGSEDYVGSAWGLGTFAHAYAGCTVADGATQSYAFYRYHVPDPIYFRSDVHVTIQQIGCWDPKSIPVFRDAGRAVPAIAGGNVDWNDPKLPPYGLFERQDDVSSCAYFYLDRPDDDLPPLPPVAVRTRGLAAE
ncbi:MAG TPA: glycoside hydrolase family 172 protein [Opitutus sp.]|nr:glycoside hydrolase family 172 protein [Opitutus sp.]